MRPRGWPLFQFRSVVADADDQFTRLVLPQTVLLGEIPDLVILIAGDLASIWLSYTAFGDRSRKPRSSLSPAGTELGAPNVVVRRGL
jgi:hypothetical protein